MAPLYCFLTFLWTGFTAELGYVSNLYIFYDKAPPYSFCFPEQVQFSFVASNLKNLNLSTLLIISFGTGIFQAADKDQPEEQRNV